MLAGMMVRSQRSRSLPQHRPSTNNAPSMPPKKAIEILTGLISDAAYLESEPFGSPKRSQWIDTAQGALERSFGIGSSILDSFGAAQSIVFHKGDSEEALRKIANRNLASTVAILRSGVERLRWEIEEVEPTKAAIQENAIGANVLIFISHSSKDAALAEGLIELLRTALGLAANQIRCTSVDGYRLPVGVNTESELREEVNAARVVVGLITPSSLASHFVIFELGARWGSGLFLAPLLAGVEPNELSAPLGLLNALSANNEVQLHHLLKDLSRQLGLPLQDTASYLRNVARVKQLADATPNSATVKPAAPAPAEDDFKISFSTEGAPPSQVIKVVANQPITVSRLEYMLTNEACIVSEDISLEGETLEVPLNHDSLTKLLNTPRADMNHYDCSGPAKIGFS